MQSKRIKELEGPIFLGATGASENSEMLILEFENTDGFHPLTAKFYHPQDCCENVSIVDVCGDFSDLEGQPLTVVEVVRGGEDMDPEGTYDVYESFTFTLFKFRGPRGDVTVRWLGESNGYYGEDVEVDLEDERIHSSWDWS